MKKIIALALALLWLLAAAAVCEEAPGAEAFDDSGASMASTLELTNMTISVVQSGRAKGVRLKDMTLRLTMGGAEGVPTMQVNFDNGKGQQVDAVIQIVDSRLLMAVGGIAGTYYVDLERIGGEDGLGAQVATGYGKAMMLAGPHLDVLLMALPTTDASGMRTLEISLPNRIYTAVAEAMLAVAEGMDSTEETDVEGLREQVDSSGEDAVLSIRYRQSTGDIEIAAMQGKSGAQIAATMAMKVEPTVMVNISADEEQYDLMNLDADTLELMRSELEMIALKFGNFAGGTGLSRIFKLK